MEASGCIGVFLGVESMDAGSLRDANKRQNRVADYGRAIERLHARGICVMAGFVAGFDHDTPETIVAMADALQDMGVDVPFLSVLTPFRGTPLHASLQAEGRLLYDEAEAPWPVYNGYNVAFQPARMSPGALHDAHRGLWRRAFSPRRALARAARPLRPGAWTMSAVMNGFYAWKQATGNLPADLRGAIKPRASALPLAAK